MQGLQTHGVLYIVFGNRYQAEARKSIASLTRVCPAMRVAAITDSEWSTDPRPDLFILKEPEASYGLKMRYAHDSPFDRTLCLDSDTIIARDILPIFGLLDYYDVGFHFGGPPIDEPDGLKFQLRAATSVFLFTRNERVSTFFELWSKEYYLQKAALEASGRAFDARGLDDTRSCAIAIARSEVRPVQLGSFLYFDLGTATTTCSPPRIYHGRMPLMELVDEEITGKWRPERDWNARIWLPNIRGLLPNGIRRSDPLLAAALVLRRLYNSTKRRLKGRIQWGKRFRRDAAE
jgi:hypothetical protein